MKKSTLGVIIGNRGFFPSELCESGRKTILKILGSLDIAVVTLSSEDTQYGSVESLADAHKCAELFKNHQDEIDGILVTLPNFGDERAIANTLRWSQLDVPILIHAFPDTSEKMLLANRRDSFCGKMSVCNNLKQYGIPYSLTMRHTLEPESEEFKNEIRDFCALCRVVNGLRNARFGVIGARPAAFNTVRFSEKLLERSGITVETLDLSEVFAQASALKEDTRTLKEKITEINDYITNTGVPVPAIEKMARLGVVIDSWMEKNELVASAIQCWTAMETYYGVVPCTLMSMCSNKLMPSGCETDISGVVGMYAMTLASQKPSALADWNNNYDDEADKGVLFHCSNWPRDLFESSSAEKTGAAMGFQAILAGDVGKQNTYGTVVGKMRKGDFTFCRVSTNDFKGKITAYLGEGQVTDDTLETFGGYGVVKIHRLQDLLLYICENGYEHHVAVNPSRVAKILNEAFSKYLHWDVYYHC
jgi:L-fucose isomerase-like protein